MSVENTDSQNETASATISESAEVV